MLPPERRPVRHPFGDDLSANEIQAFALPELAPGKTIAPVRRGPARDSFDVAMLAVLPDIDDQLLTTASVVRGAGYPQPSPLDYSAAIADRVRPVRRRSQVRALVRGPIPVTLAAAREAAGHFVGRATSFTADDRECLRRLDAGELPPSCSAT